MRSPRSRSCSPDSAGIDRPWWLLQRDNRSTLGGPSSANPGQARKLDAERPPVVFGQEQVLRQEVFEALCERYSNLHASTIPCSILESALAISNKCVIWPNIQQSELARAGVAAQSMDRIKSLIMATCHSAAPMEPDQCLLVDIDLSILGASEKRFQEYERQIREEYSFVPETIFIQKRREILKSFLARQRIYSTCYFFDRLESLARRDLTQAVRA